jgi:tetratricopeptide (TPR) repeat protein
MLLRSSALTLTLSLFFTPVMRAATDAQLIRAGKFQQARAELERDLRSNDSAAAHCNLGIALLHLHDYRAALDHLLSATNSEPTLTPAWLNLAACYICLNEFDRAIEAYRKVENLMPQSKPALDQLIDSLSKAGRTDETAQDYAQPNWKHWGNSEPIPVYIAHHPR